MEDDEEGGEDCPVELMLNRHGDDAYQIVMKIVMKMVIRSCHLVEQTKVWTTAFYQALVIIITQT